MAAYENQHFVPVFYSKHWADERGQVTRYVIDHGQFKVLKRGPAALGRRKNLWTITGARNPAERMRVERDLFSEEIDSKAALICETMLAGNRVITDIERGIWSRFLVSLRFRNPVFLAHNEAVLHDAAVNPDLVPPDGLPRNVDVMRAALLTGLVSARQEIDKFYGQRHWGSIRIDDDSPRKFFTSDWPLLRFNSVLGQEFPETFALPLSPTYAFFAFGTPIDRENFRLKPRRDLVRTINEAVTNSFMQDVWAVDERETYYIRSRMLRRGPLESLKIQGTPLQDRGPVG